MAAIYTRKALIERIKKHMAGGFPQADWNISENEMQLYIDQAIAFGIIGQTYMGAKVEGALVVPDAYLITYQLAALVRDNTTGDWYTTLPQPPLSLPLGYSVTDAYFAEAANGKSQPIFILKTKRKSFRNFMPKPTGVFGWVENSRFWLSATDGNSLLGITAYIQMPSARTTDINETMNLPDDAIEAIFTSVVSKLKDRMQIPQDTVEDNLPSGRKDYVIKQANG